MGCRGLSPGLEGLDAEAGFDGAEGASGLVDLAFG